MKAGDTTVHKWCNLLPCTFKAKVNIMECCGCELITYGATTHSAVSWLHISNYPPQTCNHKKMVCSSIWCNQIQNINACVTFNQSLHAVHHYKSSVPNVVSSMCDFLATAHDSRFLRPTLNVFNHWLCQTGIAIGTHHNTRVHVVVVFVCKLILKWKCTI